MMPDNDKFEEIELDAKPAPQPEAEIKRATKPAIEARVGSIKLPQDASNQDVLQAILAAQPEQLIPWEDCQLPSGGRFYGWADGTVKVKAMGQAAEKSLANERLAQSGENLNYMIKECCRFPDGFSASDLLIGDRVFLVYYIRGITHGNIYEFAAKCPHCESNGTYDYDLNELASTIKRPPAGLGAEPFKVVLPYLSEVAGREVYVKLRFLRARDGAAMLARRKANERRNVRPGGGNPLLNKLKTSEPQLDDTISENLQQLIVEVMGSSDPMAIRSFVQRLHSTDTAAIREWLRINTPGIDTTVSVPCKECGKEFVIELPISDSFFRPKKRGGISEGIRQLDGADLPT